jgi:hypothetical protein
MKTCLHRLLPTAILSLSSLAQPLSAQTMYDKSQYKNFNDVKISQPYTPFGNRPEFNRYGDDGSKCVLDANGVLTWIGNKGEVRLLPDSSKAVPLFVTNTECLVWVNRFVDYDTYNDRPDAQLRLYRSTPGSSTVTSQNVTFKGKEIIDTPQVTTTTGALTFVSATRKDNKKETVDGDGDEFNYSDDCELRFYRLTFDAGVQFIRSKTVQIKNAENFDINSNGPEIQALGYGSDGSMAIKVIDERVQPTSTNPDYEGRTYWIDNQGRFQRVVKTATFLNSNTLDPDPCTRVLFVSNTRLVYEHSTTATPPVLGIQEQRRNSSTGNLLPSSTQDLTDSVEGTTLDIWNYSQGGVNRYFYTVSTDVGSEFFVSGTLTDGVAPTPNPVKFPVLKYAGVKNGKAHFTSDGKQFATGQWYEAVWQSNRWNLKYYSAANNVSAEWRSSSAVAYPDLATGWAPVLNEIPTPPRMPTGTPTVTRTAGEAAGKVIRTYKLNSDGIFLEKTVTLAGTLEVSPATMTGTVNVKDGSALLVTEDGDALIWLHSAGYTALPNSSQASALFVDKDQAVIWENAKASVGGNGQIPNAIVKHYKQGGALATTIRTDDNKTLLNTSRLTPDPEYWFFTTAIKTDASTSRLTTYKLGTVEIANVDTDKDGLLDYNEVNPESPTPKTDPKKADTDGDRLEDGYELKVSKTNPTKKDTDGDGLNDGAEVTKYFTNPLVADTDEDGINDGTEVKGWKVGAVTYKSDPLLIDTDDDGFEDKTEKDKGTNPKNNQSWPESPSLTDAEKKRNMQVRLERTPADISIAQPFAPFGNRTDLNRFGDDGSAMLVDVNGVLIWRGASGETRLIPNSELHIPLVVSNSEAIVWTNGFKDYAEYEDKENVTVAIYRADANGNILAPVPVSLQGREILATAPITTTSQAYHVVTSDHAYDGGDIIFRIYRITYSGQAQALGQIILNSELEPENSLALTKVMGHGSDGSIVFSQDSYSEGPFYTGPTVVDGITLIGDTYDHRRQVFWVDGVRSAVVGAGIWERIHDGIERRNINEGFPDFDFKRVISTSRTQVVYEKLDGSTAKIYERRRNNFTGALSNNESPISAVSDFGAALQISTQTLEGDQRWVYALSKDAKSIITCKLSNSGLNLVSRASIPEGVSIDDSATVININRLDGSAVISSDSSPSILWLHREDPNGQSELGKIDVIPNIGAASARALFVTMNELVLWNNNGAPVLPNGSIPPAVITHYAYAIVPSNTVPPNTKPTIVRTSLSAKIDGTYVMSVPPFTSAPEIGVIPGQYEWPWLFTTVEKTGSATTRFRTYRLQNWNIFDEDGDGLGSRKEEKFKTSPQNPDTDGDGVSDGFEVQPFRIVTGNFNFEEARLDAIAKGGRLARPNTKARLESIARQVRGLNTGMRLWIGGSDMDAPKGIGNQYEGKYRWVDASGRFFNTGVSPAAPVGANFTYTNWGKGQPSDVGNLDGVQLDANFTWSMASLAQRQSYILETKPTNPLVPDGPGDLDGDGLSDAMEFALKTNPNIADTDNDGLSDLTEAGVLFSNPLTGFLSGAPVTLAKASYEGLLYNEKSGLLGKISVNMENNGTFTGTYEIYNGFKSSIKGTLNKNNGLLVANSFAANPAIGATTIALQRDSQTGRNHLHVRVNNPTFGLLFAKARPAATGFKPVRNRFTLEAPLSEEASGPTGTMVATGSIAANGGTTSLQMYNPDGTTASSSGRVLDGGVIALYAKSSGSTPTHVMANIKVNNVLNTRSNFDAQLRLLTNEYDQDRTLEGSFYTAPAPRTLPISSFNASNTANNAVFNWTDGELDKAYQVNSWRPAEISPPKTNYDKTVATFTTATGLMKVDYTRSDKARNLYQAKSTAYAVVNQRKNTVNGFYSRLNWEGGSFSVNPNSLKLTVPPIEPPDAPIEIPGSVTSISPASKSVGTGAATYNIKVTGVDNWKVSIDESPSWVSAEVVNDDKSQWADKLTGRDNATVKITLLANNDIEARTATINIGGKDHELTQSSGAASKITPPSKIAVKKGESYTIRVEAQGLWKAIPSVNWLIVKVANDNQYVDATSPNSTGSGNATITVQVQPNLTGWPRLDGVINIGGLEHTVKQNSY